MLFIDATFLDHVYGYETSGLEQTWCQEDCWWMMSQLLLPEIMKTLTRVQAIGMARRTKMDLLIACCVQNERDEEVSEDSGGFYFAW